MNNQNSTGATLTIPAPAGGVLSGVPFALGNSLAIPVTDAPGTTPVAVMVEGVFDLPIAKTAEVSAYEMLAWSVDSGEFVATPAKDDLVGCAMALEASTDEDEIIRVKLIPGVAEIDEGGE